jgi:hypothetical protein
MHFSPKKNYYRWLLTCIFFLSALMNVVYAQAPVLRVTNNFTQQAVLYNADTFSHTAWQPVLYTDSDYIKTNRSWLHRKFFEEHLLQVQQPDYNIFADVIFDEYIGSTKRSIPTVIQPGGASNSVYMNTRGYDLSGNIGNKFYFQTDLYENQAKFPGYVDSFARTTGVVPFQNSFKAEDNNVIDFSYSTAKLIYTPNKHFLFNLGYGTNFIGDGYRSLLLSDYNTNYPYFRTAVTFGKLQYSVMWSQYISEKNPYTYAQGYPRKWGQTYLLDWQATKHFNIGIFNAVVSSIEDANHNKDFGLTHFSPVIFLHNSTSPSGLKNNNIYGLNLKYSISPYINVYAQYMLNKTGSADWGKSYGYQLGVRAGNLFKINNLNAQLEFNTVRPYSYAADTITTVYAHNNQTLAHPLGANFKEGIFVTDYTYKRWWLRLEAMVAEYGVDSTETVNYGRNIYKPLYTHSADGNISTGQGLHTNLFYTDARVAYILNKKTNLRLETGVVYRNEKNDLKTYTDLSFYVGVRFTFRKLIYDF